MSGSSISLRTSKFNNLRGNKITTLVSYGIGISLDYSSRNNVTNNQINTFGHDAEGISLTSNSFYNNLSSNTINLAGKNAWGIYVGEVSLYNNIEKNKISTSGENGCGIALEASYVISISNNTINTSGDNGWGIVIWRDPAAGPSMTDEITNNTINTFGKRAYGIYVYRSIVDNIINNQIYTSDQNAYGIYIYKTLNINLLNNIINTSGVRGYGIYQYNSLDNTLTSNTINTFGSRGDGIYFQQSSNNEMIENRINTSGGAYGIFLYQNSNQNELIRNNIKTKNENGHGIYIYDSDNSYLSNCNITTIGTNSNGLYLKGKSATITNSTILTNPSSYGIITINEGEIIATNCSFTTVSVTSDGGGILKVKNYLTILVYDDDSITPISDVDIEVRDNNAQIYASTGYGGSDSTTNSNGRTESIIVTDCWYYYSNYATENITKIKVKKEFTDLWEVVRSDVDMSTSHTEIFYHDITAPSIPTGLKVTRVPGTNSLNISWDLNQDTVKYKLYSNKTGQWEILSNVIHPQNWTLDEDLPDKTWYYYKIQALDKVDLSSELSEAVNYYLTDITPPVIPSGLTVKPVPGGDALNISWDLNPDNPLGYDITWDDPETKDWKIISNVTHPKAWYIFSHKSLVNGSTYYFKIRACYQEILPSIYSVPVKVIHRDYLAPEPPTDLKAKAISESEIMLTWNKSKDHDVQGYRIYTNQSRSGVNKTYNFFGETKNLDYNITGLTENTKYFFVIKAFDEANNTSPFSGETWAITLIVPEQPMIVSTIPIQNSTDIAVNTSVIIIFNVPMNILTVVKVLDISPVIQYNLTWLKNNTELRIDFINNLSYNTSYVITIGMAKSETSLVLKDHPFILNFKTEEEIITPSSSPIPTINITSPVNNTQVKPGELIIVTGSSSSLTKGTQVTITLFGKTATGKVLANGTWSITIPAPDAKGTYTLEIKIGNLSKSISIIVIEDEGKDNDDKKGDKGIFGMGTMVDLVLVLIIIIIIIIIILIIVVKRMKSKRVDKEEEEQEEENFKEKEMEGNENEE